VFFLMGCLAIGAAAVHSGNNLLFLLLGAMVGVILVSGVVSERMLRGLRVERLLPSGSPLQVPFPLRYTVGNLKRRVPSLAIRVGERELGSSALVSHVAPLRDVEARCEVSFKHRGVYTLGPLSLATAFPFGLFVKERRLEVPAELVIWPRTDLEPPDPWASDTRGRTSRRGQLSGVSGARGEFDALREYRSGDDVRDVHWRSTARVGEPIMRSFLDESGESRWLVIDTRSPAGEAAEQALANVASIARRYTQASIPFGVLAGATRVQPGRGTRHLERALDALARVDFGARQAPALPATDEPAAVYSAARPGGQVRDTSDAQPL